MCLIGLRKGVENALLSGGTNLASYFFFSLLFSDITNKFV